MKEKDIQKNIYKRNSNKEDLLVEKFNNFFEKIFKKLEKEKKLKKEENFLEDNIEKKIKRITEKNLLIFEKPIKKFLKEIEDKLKNNYYEVLIGDDVKGRIPTLILKEVFNYFRQKNNLKNIDVKFISGGKSVYWTSRKFNNVVDLLNKMNLKNKKILLVTEYMLDEGFLKLANALKFSNLDFDCFSCFSRFQKKYYLEKGKEIFKNSNLYIGKENADPFADLDFYSFVGVIKKDSYSSLVKGLKTDKYVVFLRKKIKELAQKIIDELAEK